MTWGPPWSVLADDFTGACDVAGAFAARGLRPVVHLGAASEGTLDGRPAVIDADLRDAPPEARAKRLGEALWASREARRAVAFLKVDSTLRGDIAGYLRQLIEQGGYEGALLAPAFPEQGRGLIGGRLQRNLIEDVQAPDLMASLEAAFLPACLVPRERTLAAGAELEAVLRRCFDEGVRVAVCDATTPAHLQGVARAWLGHQGRWLLAGSAGIARQLAALISQDPVRGPTPPYMPGNAPILVVAGSPEPATRRQVDALRAGLEVRAVEVDEGSLAAPVPAALGGDVLLLASGRAQGDAPASRDSGEMARALARACRSLADGWRPGGLVVAGGATARALCEELAVHTVRIEGEMSPGVPHGRLQGGPWHGLQTVTKAGGFGGPELLLDAVAFLEARNLHKGSLAT